MADRERIHFRELLVHALIVSALIAILFPGTVLRGEVAIASDLLYSVPPWDHHIPSDYEPVRNETTLESVTQFSAWYRVTQEALHDGEWPLWNPYPFTGVPLLANYQSAVVYPVHVLNAFVDIPVAMTIYLLVKLWLCGMFGFVCARGLGLSMFPAQIASLGWMLGGYVQVWCYWAEVDVVAWLPLMLLSAEFLATGRERRGFFLMSLSATLMLLAGHPETALVVSSGVACYFFIRLAQVRNNLPRIIGLASAAWAFALLINAIQILPFLEYLKHSHTFSYRAVEENIDYFVPSHGFLALIVPKFFGFTSDGNYWGDGKPNSNFVHIVYVSVPVLMGIVCLLVRGAPALLRRRSIALAPPAILSLLLAFDLPVLARLHDLPVLSSAWEIHALSFAAFGLPLLGAMGFQAWFSRPRTIRELFPAAFLTALIVGVLWMAYSTYAYSLPNDGMLAYEQFQIVIAVGLAIATLALLAHHVFSASKRLAMAGLVFVLAADLLIASAGMRPTTRRADVFADTEVTNTLLGIDGPVRVAATATNAAGNIYPNFGIEQLYGYDGIFPARIKRFMNELLPNAEAWAKAEPLLSVSHYLHPVGVLKPDDAPDQYRLELTAEGVEVRANLKALPRARLVGQIEQFKSEDAILHRIAEEDFNGARTLLMRTNASTAFPTSDATELGSAEIVSRTTQSVEVAVDALEPCMLVLSDAYYPGWRAVVDGVRVQVYPAYHALRAVPVPAGNYTVQLKYSPWSFWIGYVVSVIGLLGSLILGLIAWKRFR